MPPDNRLSEQNPGHSQYRQQLARIALDEMYQFVAVLDAQGTLLEVNRAALEGGGLTLSDVEGKPFWECFWWGVSTDIQETLRTAIARAAQGEFIRYDVEVYGRASGKETIIIDFSMIPVKDDTGKVVFIVPEGRDITAKKAHEREIAQKNADLQVLLKRIRELDEIKTQFFANVSHELRTPLALIIGPAERLLKADATTRPEDQGEAAQVIVRNARMLLKHVNDLLDLSKLDAGKLTIELRETNVVALIRFVASHFDILAAERPVDFRVETAESCLAAVDPEKLERVVMNLLSNAFKFVPTGGVVRCTLESSRQNLVLSVEDSGPGVRPELRTAIFERFRQGDGGADRQFAGTGLGLAIAHEFVELHMGSIEVSESDLGGALFRVTLPANHVSPSAVKRPRPPESQRDHSTLDGLIEELRLVASARPAIEPSKPEGTTNATVLVVEDNRDMNRFVAQCLSRDYHVVSAFDGQEGLEKALAIVPALIVSDIMMPRVSGAEMVAALRERPEMFETPILLLSAKADEELKNQLLEHGAQDFVTKPFTERDLLVRVRNLISMRQSREASRDAERAKRQVVEAANRDLQEQGHELEMQSQQLQQQSAELEATNDELSVANEALMQANNELARARADADAANQAKLDFLKVMSHDLRTPLNAINGYVELLETGIRGPVTTAQTEDLRRIRRASTHLMGLIGNVLNFAKVDAAQLDYQIEPVAVDRLLADAAAIIEPVARAKGIMFERAPASVSLTMISDRDKVMQVLVNLLTNAIKFTAAGGRVRLVCESVPGDRLVRFAVEDTGQGIAPDQLERIFEPFVQIGRRLYGTDEGAGLGLAISRNLARALGGDLTVISAPARGSTFTVILPSDRAGVATK